MSICKNLSPLDFNSYLRQANGRVGTGEGKYVVSIYYKKLRPRSGSTKGGFVQVNFDSAEKALEYADGFPRDRLAKPIEIACLSR